METEGSVELSLHFLHVVSVIVWLGGVLTSNGLAVAVGRGPDRRVQAAMLRLSDLYGRAVIAPAGALTLITGLLLVFIGEDDLSLSTAWIAWGIIGLLVSLVLGATAIRATHADLRRLTERGVDDESRRVARQRRAVALYTLNVLILLSVVWAMVFKPTL